MAGYLIRRVLTGAITMVLVILAVFVIFVVVPGGPGRSAYGPGTVSPVAIFLAGKRAQNRNYLEQLTEELNFGVPLREQFSMYMKKLIRGDFGTDFVSGTPIRSRIFAAVPVSLGLMVGASMIWLIAAVVAGSYAARRRGSPADKAMSGVASGLMSLPVFVTGLLLLAVLVPRDWYRMHTYVPISENLYDYVEAMWLPWLVLAASYVGAYFRLVRGNMLNVEHEDFIRTADAKGLPEVKVVRHQLRYSIGPVISLYSADVAVLAGSLIIVESIFELPGLGSLLAGSISSYAFNTIAGVTLLGSFFVVVVGIAVDVVYAAIDPRLRGKKGR